MHLAIVVVTHNSAHDLPGLLATIPDRTADHEISVVVVDSGSDDGSLGVAAGSRPDAITVDLGGNRGYAAGVNAGWAAVANRADVMVLLNPDLTLADDVLDRWVAALDAPDTGIVAPLIVDEGGQRQFSLRRAPGPVRAWSEAILGGTIAGRLGLGELITDADAYRRDTVCAWATGAALAISAPCIEAVGPWEERYFLYAEETEFCLRAGRAGYATRLEPSACVTHRGGEMAVAPALYALMAWNRVRIQRKLNGRIAAELVRLGAAIGDAIRWVAGSRRPVRAAALAALLRPSRRADVLPPQTDLGWRGVPG